MLCFLKRWDQLWLCCAALALHACQGKDYNHAVSVSHTQCCSALLQQNVAPAAMNELPWITHGYLFACVFHHKELLIQQQVPEKCLQSPHHLQWISRRQGNPLLVTTHCRSHCGVRTTYVLCYLQLIVARLASSTLFQYIHYNKSGALACSQLPSKHASNFVMAMGGHQSDSYIGVDGSRSHISQQCDQGHLQTHVCPKHHLGCYQRTGKLLCYRHKLFCLWIKLFPEGNEAQLARHERLQGLRYPAPRQT